MRINTKTVWQMNADGSMTLLQRESHDYDGSVAQAFGGRSTTTTVQETTSTQVGLQDIEGVGIAATGDVEFMQTVTDLGAIQGAFDFAGDVGRQAGELSQQAVAISAGAVKTVGEATRSDTQQGLVKIAGFAALAVGVFFVANAFRRA